ncbi:hypothetical protein POTOM_030024 [Populus tomentosa]|uniref:Uncharacterized protein n=1 Tax=Populus tomentosa TaxID=118781 RepID=A0A8X7ZB67_POPTO|nr:hypothetical protein POTOM_030024 [Populus tomentosa]
MNRNLSMGFYPDLQKPLIHFSNYRKSTSKRVYPFITDKISDLHQNLIIQSRVQGLFNDMISRHDNTSLFTASLSSMQASLMTRSLGESSRKEVGKDCTARQDKIIEKPRLYMLSNVDRTPVNGTSKSFDQDCLQLFISCFLSK